MASEKELNGDSDLDPENESEEEWRRKNKPVELYKLLLTFPNAAEFSWGGLSLWQDAKDRRTFPNS